MTLSARAGFVLSTLFIFTACKATEARKEASGGEPAVLAWPLSTKSAEARTHFEDGQAANDRGRPLKAYEQFKRSVAADSAFALGYLGVAQRALSLDEYRTNLLRATAYEAGANETEKLLIDIERKEFDRDQQAALALAQQLAAKQPGNPRSWWVLAGEYRSTGQTEASRASLKKAIDLAPEYGATHLIYAQDYTVNQPTDLATAEQQVLAGGKIWPREPLSYDYLGDVRRAQGRLEEAAAAYGRQIELDPQNYGGYIQRAHSYTFLGKYDKARADYDAAIRVASGNDKVFTARCKAYVSAFAGNPDDALKQLDQLSQAIDGMGVPEPEGEKIETLNSEAIIATYAHRFDIAEKALGQARPLVLHSVQRVGTPEFRRGQEAGLAYADGIVAAFKGDFAAADAKAAEFQKLVAQDRNPTKNRPAHDLRGFVALFQKRYNDAIAEFDQGSPDNPFIWYHRALALEGAGRTDEAKAQFHRVATFNFSVAGYSAVRKDAVAKAG